MYRHRSTLSAMYVTAGVLYGIIVHRDFEAILVAQRAFFDLAPAWYANASTIVIAAAPLGLIATGIALSQRASWPIILIAAIYATIFTLGYVTVALAAYLIWFFVFGSRDSAS